MSTAPHPATDTGLPHCQVDGARATVRLNRPAHHNRLHRADLLALQRHCAELATSQVRVVVLQAEGPTFCAGFNLDELDADAQGGPLLFEQTVEAIEALPMPTIPNPTKNRIGPTQALTCTAGTMAPRSLSGP